MYSSESGSAVSSSVAASDGAAVKTLNKLTLHCGPSTALLEELNQSVAAVTFSEEVPPELLDSVLAFPGTDFSQQRLFPPLEFMPDVARDKTIQVTTYIEPEGVASEPTEWRPKPPDEDIVPVRDAVAPVVEALRRQHPEVDTLPEADAVPEDLDVVMQGTPSFTEQASLAPDASLPLRREAAPSFTERDAFAAFPEGLRQDPRSAGGGPLASAVPVAAPSASCSSPALEALMDAARAVQPEPVDRQYILLEAQKQKAQVDKTMREQLMKLEHDFSQQLASIHAEASQKLQESRRDIEAKKREQFAQVSRQPLPSLKLKRLEEDRQKLIEEASSAIVAKMAKDKASGTSGQNLALIERQGHDALARLRLVGPRPTMIHLGRPGYLPDLHRQ